MLLKLKMSTISAVSVASAASAASAFDDNDNDNIYHDIVKHYNDNIVDLETKEGGQIRASRGELVENMIDIVCKHLGIKSLKGSNDMKVITVTGRDGNVYKQSHQVDRHLYYRGSLIAVVECKAYLDACYYVRACSDFKRMKKEYPGIKAFIFSLENSISDNSLAFTDVDFDYVCDGIFFMCDGKRSSSKPIYMKKYYKSIVSDKLIAFVNTLKKLLH